MNPVRQASDPTQEPREIVVEFDDNSLLPQLFGPRDQNLELVEQQLQVRLVARGNRIGVSGTAPSVERARSVLSRLYGRLKEGLEVTPDEVAAAVRLSPASGAGEAEAPVAESAIRTRKRHITPRTAGQARYIQCLRERQLTFGLGPAGTGKTYLAVALAVDMLMTGKVERIVLSRPAVEAGERLGFLPGDLKDKVDPYLRPLYDALHDMLPHEQVLKRLGNGDIEVAPLAFMRGRTLAHSFVILDEAQNATPVQMKMFLTRLGEGSVMAVTGDPTQSDLPGGTLSGLDDALEALEHVPEIGVVRFTEQDVVRHPLVMQIVEAYAAREAKPKERRARQAPQGLA